MNEFEQYLEKLFSDPGFATVLTILSIWYSFYLFKRPKIKNNLLFLTTSYPSKKGLHETFLVIINNGDCDITDKDILEGNPLKITFNENMALENFELKYNSSFQSDIKLISNSNNDYKIQFNIFKIGHGIILSAKHRSKKHIDEMWTDLKVDGVIINFIIVRDDFSSHLLSRNQKAELPSLLMAIIPAILISFSLLAFLRPLHYKLPFQYLFITCFILCFSFFFNYLTNKNGHASYKAYWKLFKRYKRESKQ